MTVTVVAQSYGHCPPKGLEDEDGYEVGAEEDQRRDAQDIEL